jgi:hypothetical protein
VKPADYEVFVRQLTSLGLAFCTVRAAAQSYHTELPAIFFNEMNGVPHHLAAVLACAVPGEPPRVFQEKSSLVANYLDLLYVREFVNRTIKEASNIEADVLSLIPRLRDARDKSQLKELLSREAAKSTTGFKGIATYGLTPSNRKQVRYLLARITAYAETQIGEPDRVGEYLDDERPYEIEHILSNKHIETDDPDAMRSFESSRSRLGALLLLPKSDNASYGALPYATKLESYARQNILAASLHPSTYSIHPRFTQFTRRVHLDQEFRPFPSSFDGSAILARQKLYQRLCELAWSTDRLGFEPTAAKTSSRSASAKPAPSMITRRTTPLMKLLESGALDPDEILIGVKRNARTKEALEYGAQVLADSRILVDSGETFPDLDSAGAAVLGLRSCKGWEFWHVLRGNQRISLRDLRRQTVGR